VSSLKGVNPATGDSLEPGFPEATDDLGDELLERAHAETALPLPRLTGERAHTVAPLVLFADVVDEGSWVEARIDEARIDQPLPDRQPAPRPDLRRMLVPLGPVARGLEGHLTATVHGTPTDLEEYAELLQVLTRKAGRIVVNGFPTGVFRLLDGRLTKDAC